MLLDLNVEVSSATDPPSRRAQAVLGAPSLQPQATWAQPAVHQPVPHYVGQQPQAADVHRRVQAPGMPGGEAGLEGGLPISAETIAKACWTGCATNAVHFSPALPVSQIGHLGLGAYGGNLLGAGQSFVQQNYARYVATGAHQRRLQVCARLVFDRQSCPAGNELRYYFTVNNRYVRNKLRMLLFPFSVRGHWHRALDQVGAPLGPQRCWLEPRLTHARRGSRTRTAARSISRPCRTSTRRTCTYP